MNERLENFLARLVLAVALVAGAFVAKQKMGRQQIHHPTEDELIQCARERIDDGRLPEIMPSLISAGYGAGTALCALCDVEILSDHAMYEVNDPRGPDKVLTFHFPCYVIWQCECE